MNEKYMSMQDGNFNNNNIIIILAQSPEIGQGLGRFLSCGARKPEQTQKDL